MMPWKSFFRHIQIKEENEIIAIIQPYVSYYTYGKESIIRW